MEVIGIVFAAWFGLCLLAVMMCRMAARDVDGAPDPAPARTVDPRT